MMAWPRTEKVGEETVGLGRGWRDCLSRKWASYLDLVWMDMVGYGVADIGYLLEVSWFEFLRLKGSATGYVARIEAILFRRQHFSSLARPGSMNKRRQAGVKQIDEFK